MILYNVTVKVDWSIQADWLQWMKEVYIPGMMSSGFFVEFRMVKLLEVEEYDGPTYAVQYYVDSIENYHLFVETQLPVQSQLESAKWGHKLVSFSTIMEVVH